MDGQTNIEEHLRVIEEKVDAAFASAEKTRKMIMWTGIISAVVIVGPLLLLPLVIGPFLASLTLPVGF